MYVCLCRGVTERQVKQALEEGARSLGDLHRELGVGGDCGRCRCKAREMVHHHLVLEAQAWQGARPLHIYRLHPLGSQGTDPAPSARAVA